MSTKAENLEKISRVLAEIFIYLLIYYIIVHMVQQK